MLLHAVTFNLRMNNLRDGVNYFFNRAPFILSKLKKEAPDIIGFQEATKPIYEWLKCNLTEYVFVGLGRGECFDDEANPIAFKKDRFELYSFNQFWLSPTPTIPGSRHEGQSICPRVCTAVALREKSSTMVVRIYNTHLDHVGATARLRGITSILDLIREDYERNPLPIILMGDMNARPDEVSMEAVRSFATPKLTDVTASVLNSFHAFCGSDPFEAGEKIDYIYTDLSPKPDSCVAWSESFDGIYLSDHYPISVMLTNN